jgi:hypothetical protein
MPNARGIVVPFPACGLRRDAVYLNLGKPRSIWIQSWTIRMGAHMLASHVASRLPISRWQCWGDASGRLCDYLIGLCE